MTVDTDTVRRIAKLARIALAEGEAERLVGDFNNILGFVEQLDAVDVDGVEPMTSVTPMALPLRADVITDGNRAADILANSPAREGDFFAVPKVVE
jgi:aspartyl-tRNA(Asn)/glutamyl-tRNA(Gln) amidotransferase subunit C